MIEVVRRVVSLPESSRRQSFLQRTGWPSDVFFEAVNPEAATVQGWDAAAFHDRNGRTAKNGEIGCSLSHAQILREYAASPADPDGYLLVLEDDAVLSPEFETALARLLEADVKADFILLGVVWGKIGEPASDSSLTNVPISWLAKKVNLFPSSPTNFLVGLMRPNNFAGTLGYLVTKRAAERYAKVIPETIYWVADDWHILYDAGFRICLVRPNIIEEAPGDASTIRHLTNSSKHEPHSEPTEHNSRWRRYSRQARAGLGVTARDLRDRLRGRTTLDAVRVDQTTSAVASVR